MNITARQAMQLATSEEDLLAAVTEALELFGWVWMHPRRSDKALVMGHQGVPDVIAVRGGRVLFLELKSQGGTLSRDQLAWRLEMPVESRAVTYAVVYPADLDSVLSLLAAP